MLHLCFQMSWCVFIWGVLLNNLQEPTARLSCDNHTQSPQNSRESTDRCSGEKEKPVLYVTDFRKDVFPYAASKPHRRWPVFSFSTECLRASCRCLSNEHSGSSASPSGTGVFRDQNGWRDRDGSSGCLSQAPESAF